MITRWLRKAEQQRKMTAGGNARCGDLVRVKAQRVCMLNQPLNRLPRASSSCAEMARLTAPVDNQCLQGRNHDSSAYAKLNHYGDQHMPKLLRRMLIISGYPS